MNIMALFIVQIKEKHSKMIAFQTVFKKTISYIDHLWWRIFICVRNFPYHRHSFILTWSICVYFKTWCIIVRKLDRKFMIWYVLCFILHLNCFSNPYFTPSIYSQFSQGQFTSLLCVLLMLGKRYNILTFMRWLSTHTLFDMKRSPRKVWQ